MAVRHTERPDAKDHEALALWAADCAERVLPLFEDNLPEDDRPRNAIEAARAQARGELPVAVAREAAFAAHAAARDTDVKAARLAARAAGHAAATAHVADHARHAAAYALKAATAANPTDAGDVAAAEREWQSRALASFFPSGPDPNRAKQAWALAEI
jgi:hypothetical protein